MADISEVSGITGSTLELFKAAGMEAAESLIGRRVSEILADLDEANSQYEVAVRRPSETTIRAWQDSARILLQKQERPTAKMVSAETMREAGIDVNVVPVAKVVADLPPLPLEELRRPEPRAKMAQTAETGVSVAGRPAAPAKAEGPLERAAKPQNSEELFGKPALQSPVQPKNLPVAQGTTFDRKEKGASPAKSLPIKKVSAAQADVPLDRIGSEAPPAREKEIELDPSANRFRHVQAVKEAKPQGERRNRGMSHPDALRVRLAATITVLALIACILAVAALVGALVMARVYGWEFHWTISLVLLVFPTALISYLSLGAKARCRLCGQRLFVPKNCLKHERARRSVFGYTFAVARDAMLLGRYRCMLCGTKTRLKN